MTCAPAYVAALAGFDQMTSARLRSLLAGRSPADAFAIAAGNRDPAPPVAALFQRRPELRGAWIRSAASRDPDLVWAECRRLDLEVLVHGDPRFPPQLMHDPEPPVVLFVRGDVDALDARRVGIVGTRNPTQRGRQSAARFGYELADAGVVVVSGLARGIDGAAHRGALAAGGRPIGVVANGHDSPYPREHRELWREVAAAGAVISEWPPGTRPDAFRFPLRNRILAALSELVVVVESRERGGSLITARQALERSVDVFAVPGPIDSRASAGTNLLLRDGAGTAHEPDDLLVALGIDERRSGRAAIDSRPLPRGVEAEILTRCRESAVTVERIAEALHLPLSDAALGLARLERTGWVAETGGWFEPLDEWSTLL